MNITPIDPTKATTAESGSEVETGQWYWVKDHCNWDGHWGKNSKKGDVREWLGCVMSIGSNYIEVRGPTKGGELSDRILFEDFWTEMRFEPDAQAHIDAKIAGYRDEANRLMGRVQEITAAIGVVPKQRIADHGTGEANALSVMSEQVDVKGYKTALVAAKEKTLPELFKQIEESHKAMASWLAAPTFPMRALLAPMKATLGRIEDRIHTLGLYAGLTEDAVKVRDGDPAQMGERLRLMQRRLYMDEECLLSYTGGGIDINGIAAFDAWLAQPENFERLLPFPRTMVAFRIRRNEKEREDGGSLQRMYVNVQLGMSDERTFLYVRNGEQIWRVDCDFEFDEMIFPNTVDFDPSRPMMMEMFGSRVRSLMPTLEYEDRKAEYDRKKAEVDAKAAQWLLENPDVENAGFYNPHRFHSSFRPDDYQPLDPTSVYYDEGMAMVEAEIKRYNRVVTIVQGLFDRSLVLHPHPPVQMWTAQGFAAAVEPIYDASTLTHGEKPDFEAFRARLNASLGPGSIVTGQEEFWMRREAIKLNEREKANWRIDSRSRSNYTRFRPYGDPGPGFVSVIETWKKGSRAATFRWTKERERYSYKHGYDAKPMSILVPESALLNVSAYQPGDFKQFFADPRTRQEYLKWAPLLLAAEDYHAGKIALGVPADKLDR